MKNKSNRFLTVSLISVVILCVSIFAFLAKYMSRLSSETINEVGRTYMAGMNERIAKHFETTIDLRLSQILALSKEIPQGSIEDRKLREDLAYGAQVRDFDSLAFYFDDGTYDMLYGGNVEPIAPESFLDSMKKGENRISVGTDEKGNRIVLLGVPGNFRLNGDKKCIALLAEISVDYILDTLSLEDEDSLINSFLIRRDGSFVIRQFDAYHDNYFEQIKKIYEFPEDKGEEVYIEELKEAMFAGESYTTEFEMDGSRNQLFCSSLPKCEWYLVTVMPYGMLNETVDRLSEQCALMAVGSCGVILFALMLVFIRYFQMNKEQMKALEESKRIAEKASKSKSEFLSNMSHDIRTPMNAIIGFATIAASHMEHTDQVRDCLRKILSSSNHLLGLINDILDMSRIESGKMQIHNQECNIPELMHNLVNIIQPQVKAKQLEMFIDTFEVVNEDVIADPLKLNQIFINLMGNAVKYTPAGGTVSFRIMQHTTFRHGWGEYVFVVKDNGIGMSREFVEHIFEPFERETTATRSGIQGAGLGMAITKSIIDMMDGVIEVESEVGKGSTFTVTLPLKLQDMEKTEEQIRELNGLRSLVVDDDFNVCESVSKMLKSIGMRSEWTTSGREAVYRAKAAYDEGDAYHTYIIDWQMPELSGIETARKIRSVVGKDAPIIILTAYDWTDIEEEAKEAGVTAFCARPLFMSDLKAALLAANNMDDERQAGEGKVWTRVDYSGKRLLLVEDNELNREIAEVILEEAGFQIETAPDGTDAVAMVGASEEGHYDAILMDVQMPVMNGYEATKAIRAMQRRDTKNLPIIAMTANAMEEDKETALKSGMNAHIAKPLNMELLMSVLYQFLH